MKIHISFEVDVTNEPAYNVGCLSELNLARHNWIEFIAGLKCAALELKSDTIANQKLDDLTRKALLSNYDSDIRVANQMLQSMKLVGITDNGVPFYT